MSRCCALAGVLIALLLGVVVATAQSARPPAGAAAGEFVWHDLVTANPEACRAFYSALFGWTFAPGTGVDPDYTIIRQEGRQIGGIVQMRQGADAVAQWVAYVVAADVDRAAASFQQAGGRIFRGPLNARKDLRVAVVADAQGAPLGLASRGPALEQDSGPPPLHHWLWMEYVAVDAEPALRFYGSALGFRNEVYEQRERVTYYLLSTDRPRAGLFKSPWERQTSAWLPYIRVADPAAMAARVVELGGTVALAPRPDIRNGSLAIVLDPTGAPLALQRFPFASGATP
jgi:predicted enzyme related to lactoylglutathione lyase